MRFGSFRLLTVVAGQFYFLAAAINITIICRRPGIRSSTFPPSYPLRTRCYGLWAFCQYNVLHESLFQPPSIRVSQSFSPPTHFVCIGRQAWNIIGLLLPFHLRSFVMNNFPIFLPCSIKIIAEFRSGAACEWVLKAFQLPKTIY